MIVILQVTKINKEMLKMISGIQLDDNMQICNEIHVHVVECSRAHAYDVFTLEPRLPPVTKKYSLYTEDILAHHRES